MGKDSIILYILHVLIVVVLCYPTFGYAEQCITQDGNSAQTHIAIKIIIPEGLTFSVSSLSQNSSLNDSPGIEDSHHSNLHTIDKSLNFSKSGNLIYIEPSDYHPKILALDYYKLNQYLQSNSRTTGDVQFLEQKEDSDFNESFIFVPIIKKQHTMTFFPTTSTLLPKQDGFPVYILCSP